MLKFLLIVLAVDLGVALAIGIGIFAIYCKFINFAKSIGISRSELKTMIEESEYEAKYRKKSISGMTSILMPRIIADFPNFSQSELFGKVETSLSLVFDSLTKKEVKKSNDLTIIKHNLEEQIVDLKDNKIDLVFDEVVFHKHAIKDYKKNEGVLTIKVQTSLEYFYEEKKNGVVKVKRKDYKKQTSYTSEFIYVYNPDKYLDSVDLLGVRCPNCGAPVKSLGKKSCSYCGSGLEDINLKSWFISSYKEDER